MLGHALVGAGARASSRAASRWPWLRWPLESLGVDAGAHDRVRERQRPAGLENLGGGQQGRPPTPPADRQLGQPCGLLQVAGPRSRIDTARARRRRARVGGRAGVRSSAHGAGAPIRSTCEADDAAGSTCSSRERADQLGASETASRRWRAGTRRRTPGSGSGRVRFEEVGDRDGGQRARRRTSAAGSLVSVASSPASAPDSLAWRASSTVALSPRSRGSRNVRIATRASRPSARRRRDAHRPAAAEVGGTANRSPCRTANGGSGPTATRRVRGGSWQAQQLGGDPAASLQQVGPLGRSGVRQRGFEQLAGHRRRIGAQAGAAGAQHSHLRRLGDRRRPRAASLRTDPAGPRSPASAAALAAARQCRLDHATARRAPAGRPTARRVSGPGAPGGESGRSGSDIRSARRR